MQYHTNNKHKNAYNNHTDNKNNHNLNIIEVKDLKEAQKEIKKETNFCDNGNLAFCELNLKMQRLLIKIKINGQNLSTLIDTGSTKITLFGLVQIKLFVWIEPITSPIRLSLT
jgi:hypothetical protein